MRLARFAYLIRFTQYATPQLVRLNLVQQHDSMSWINTVKHDLWWVWQTFSFLYEEMPNPLTDLHQWMSSMHNSPSWWRSVVKKCEHKCSSTVFSLPRCRNRKPSMNRSLVTSLCLCSLASRHSNSTSLLFMDTGTRFVFDHRYHMSFLCQGILAPTQGVPPYRIPIEAV